MTFPPKKWTNKLYNLLSHFTIVLFHLPDFQISVEEI